MIQRRLGISSLFQLVSVFYERFNQPGLVDTVVKDLLPCFFNNAQRTAEFVNVIDRVIWEYNFVNKMFITAFSLLSNITKIPLS